MIKTTTKWILHLFNYNRQYNDKTTEYKTTGLLPAKVDKCDHLVGVPRNVNTVEELPEEYSFFNLHHLFNKFIYSFNNIV